jgi:hypothetical protein
MRYIEEMVTNCKEKYMIERNFDADTGIKFLSSLSYEISITYNLKSRSNIRVTNLQLHLCCGKKHSTAHTCP